MTAICFLKKHVILCILHDSASSKIRAMFYIKKTYIIWEMTDNDKIQNGRRLFEKKYISIQIRKTQVKKYIFDISWQLLSMVST